MISRYEDVEFSGGTVTAGHTLELLLGSANRDPEAFDEPDRFNIHRTDMEFDKAFTAAADHTVFALGRHFCVGSMLARAELTVAMDALLDAMDDIAYADGYEQVETGVYTRGADLSAADVHAESGFCCRVRRSPSYTDTGLLDRSRLGRSEGGRTSFPCDSLRLSAYRGTTYPASSRSQVSGVMPSSRSLNFWTRSEGVLGKSSHQRT